jgi:hypothetical protein
MDTQPVELAARNLDRRPERVEQILPTGATAADVREEGERTRRSFDAAAERLRDSIRTIAEGQAALLASMQSLRAELKADAATLDRRLTRLEARRR